MELPTNPENFVRIAQQILWGVYIPKFHKMYSFGGPILPPCIDGMEELTCVTSSVQCVTITTQKSQNRPVRNLNTGICHMCFICIILILLLDWVFLVKLK